MNNKKNRVLVFSIFLPIVVLGAPVNPSLIINGYLYGDNFNSSYLQASSVFEGKVLWEKSNANKEPIPAKHIILINESVLVRFPSRLNCFYKNSGELGWSESLSDNFKFQVKDALVRTRLAGGRVGTISSRGEKSSPRYVHMIGDETFLFYLSENGHEDDFCYSLRMQPTSRPVDKGITPTFYYTRYDNRENDVIWEYRRFEHLIDILSNETAGNLYAITSNSIHIILCKGTSDDDVVTIPFSRVYQAALDTRNNIYAVVEQDEKDKKGSSKHARLVCIQNDRKIQWQYDIPSVKIAQPPSPLPDGKVLLCVGNQLLCIREGELLWTYDLPSTNSGIHLTVLKDASTLIATGPFLIKVTPEGTEENRMVLKEVLTCRPVVDSDGLVYVAGTNAIYCIK